MLLQATGFKIQHAVQKEAERLTLGEEPCLESAFRVFEAEIERIFNQEKEEIAIGAKSKKVHVTGNDAVSSSVTFNPEFVTLLSFK